MLNSRPADDRGFALVVALVITLITFVIATAVLADAFHNVSATQRVQRSIAAINVAEGGINWYANLVERSKLDGISGPGGWSGTGAGPWTISGELEGGTFDLSVTYRDADDGTPVSLDPFACPDPCRVEAVITSLGEVQGVQRRMESTLVLEPLYGNIDGAVATGFICELGNLFSISGPQADVYIVGGGVGCESGDLIVNSGQVSVSGSVYALVGSAYLTHKTFIGGDLWVKQSAQVGGGDGVGQIGSGECRFDGRVVERVVVCGSATAQSAVPTVSRHGTVLKEVVHCVAPCASPDVQLPRMRYDPLLWAGWDLVTGAPPAGSGGYSVTRWPASGSTRTVYRIASCMTALTLPSRISLAADVALISPCGFVNANNMTVTSTGAVRRTLYLITEYPVDPTASPCLPPLANGEPADARDIFFGRNLEATAVNLFVYTPCRLVFKNLAKVSGQFIAREFSAQGNTEITYAPTAIPSSQLSTLTGFRVDVLYVREVNRG